MATTTTERETSPVPVRSRPARPAPWFVELYRSAVGKKYVMAVTGIIGLGFIFVHMVGNLKVYLGEEDINHYGEFLRELLVPLFPRTVVLWLLRGTLIAAVLLHIHAAYGLTRMNQAADIKYASRRDYVAANFASRTMRWTGIIVGLYIVFHLADLTWGSANPDFVRGDVYGNMVASFERVPVAVIYIIANLALGVHLWHGCWSLFQSLGWNRPRFNQWRSWFAWGFTIVVVGGNLTFPIAVLTGVVD